MTSTPKTDRAKGLLLNAIAVTPVDIPTPPSDYTVIGDGSDVPANTTLFNSWMSKFDNLPYTSKVDLGTATNSTLHLYEYQYGNAEGIPVLAMAEVHGEESRMVAVAYWLAYNCAYSSNVFFRWMRKNINLRIIPCANPQGAVMYQRRNNANNVGTDDDVDINRNFEWRWGKNSDNTAADYAGPSAASELETQYLRLRLSTIVSSVGTITGTLAVGDTVTQTESQAIGVITAVNGTTITIRTISKTWDFTTGTLSTHRISKDGSNYQDSPVVTITRTRPVLLFDLHDTGTSLNQNIDIILPNYQLPHDYNLTQRAKAMANNIVADSGTGQCSFSDLLRGKHFGAMGVVHNYAASLGIQSYTFHSHPGAWNVDMGIADKDMVRAYVGVLSSIISLVNEIGVVELSREQNQSLYGDSAKTFGTAGATWGPDGGDTYGWTRDDYAAVPMGYTNAGILYLDEVSDVTLTLSGCARGAGAAPRLTITLWLDDSADVEVGSFKSRPFYVDCGNGEYRSLVGPAAIYHSLPAGTYKVRVNIDPSVDNVLLLYLYVNVKIVPAVRLEPSYVIDS